MIDGPSKKGYFFQETGACFYNAVSTGPFTTERREKWR